MSLLPRNGIVVRCVIQNEVLTRLQSRAVTKQRVVAGMYRYQAQKTYSAIRLN
jgi:hypothetical protein